MKNNNYTDEQKERAKELYLEGKTYAEIEAMTGVKKGTIGWLVSTLNIANRVERSPRTANEIKICPKCKKHNPIKANYCWNCGNDIRSKAELMIVKCEKILDSVYLMNPSVRDEISEDVREIIKYLKELK